MTGSKKLTLSIVVFVLTAVVLLSGYYLGYSLGSADSGVVSIQANAEDIDADFGLFWQAWQKLKENHVSADDLSDQDFVYGAVRGLAGSFDDPHTNFFPPVEAGKFLEDVSGVFAGIGAEIGVTSNQLTVVAPLKDSPAEAAGLRAGDFILAVDGERTEGMSANDAVLIIRGEVGVDVVLRIFREGWTQPREIIVTRDIIKIPTLEVTHHADDRIAQIQLFSFNENAPLAFFNAITKEVFSNTEGLILDLRNNPGGFLEVANNLAGWFLNRGEIVVSEQFKEGPNIEFRASGNGALKNVPVVILINRGSASASEILAGALRDHNGTKIVGEASFGKGTVQELLDLNDGSTLKVTVAHWVLPNGQILDEEGLTPDFEVLFTDEDIENEEDPQLAKAIEVLQEELNSRQRIFTQQ